MAFGDSNFGEPKTNTRGRGAARNRGGSGGGGGNNNRNNNRNRNRNRNPGNPFDPEPPDVPLPDGVTPLPGGAQPGGIGSIFDDETAQNASGDPDRYRPAAWGLLNQGGITQSPIFGSAGSDWLDSHIDDLYSQWEGLENVAGADRPDWHDYFGEQVGGEVPEDGMDLEWAQTVFGPAARAGLARLFQSQTPRNRQYESSRWSGPRRTVAF